MNEEQRDKRPMRRPGGGPGMGSHMGRPIEKAKNFRGSFRRLLRYLKPYKYQILAVVMLAILSTVFSIFAPKIMGKATTKLFEGILLKLRGVPGAKVDFIYIRNILLSLTGLYLFSALFSYIQQYIMAGVAQKYA